MTNDTKKILIVDDDHDTRTALAVTLRHEGYDVVFAEDGITAISLARKETPDAIVLDLGLPAGDGHTVIERLRELPEAGLAPILVSSGRDATEGKRAVEAGAFAFLPKPTDLTELKRLLSIAIRRTTESAGKILIAEDDADARRALSLRLHASNYQVAVATDGASVIPMIRKEQPDLLLLDLGLPSGDGFTTLDRINAQPDLTELPVIVVSANEPNESAGKALSKGARAYVAKPFDSSELIQIIEREIANTLLAGAMKSWN